MLSTDPPYPDRVDLVTFLSGKSYLVYYLHLHHSSDSHKLKVRWDDTVFCPQAHMKCHTFYIMYIVVLGLVSCEWGIRAVGGILIGKHPRRT